MNRFIEWIWKARNIDEKNRRAQKKHYKEFCNFMDSLKHTSPSFQDLWDISDFLNIIEYTYFYDNTRQSELWSDGNIANGKTRFNIIKDKNTEISCTLNETDNHITITIKRPKIDKTPQQVLAELSFENGKWVSYKTEYDEILLDNVISIIWDKFYWLVFKYYTENSEYCKELERNKCYCI